MAILGRAWFDSSCDAFKLSFPEFAATLPVEKFYLCPICLRFFTDHALEVGVLTREHVPPRSVGGKRMVLTCRDCNNEAGHEADKDARLEADLIGFARGTVQDIKAYVRTKSGRMPVRLSAGTSGVTVFGVGKAASKAAIAAVESDFKDGSEGDNWRDFTFNVEFAAFSPERAAASWLRSAYLAFFAALGYRFILRPELDVVRARIRNPELKEPKPFRMIRPERAEPTLLRVESPDAFKSYMMFYEHHGVFLPRYNDRQFYERLQTQPSGVITFTGKQYYWPSKGPTFFHDHEPR